MRDIFPANVISVTDLSPSLIRLVLAVGNMELFERTKHPGEWVSLWFPDAAGALPLPARNLCGKRLPRNRSRPYTLRKIDWREGTVTIDMVRHAGGLAASWAAQARMGDQLLMGQPEGRFRIAPGIDRILIFADITGLPAIARIFDEWQGQARAIAHICVPFPADRPMMFAPETHEIHWHQQSEADDQLLGSVAESISFLPGRDYVWIAAEATTVARLKRCFRAKGAYDGDVTTIGYWIRGHSRR
ncbi:hypothetical protein F8A10_19315 (plasmid) [Paracoccus kondratievae]|uniref:siderophore-interacting protein n=1 Tax=Paracoccus kondratievae TaxID=135740 RepID=UPI00126611A4|nr:siderophore-interacting protein [Paracoccus kondratievae]QFQ89592.1 hypothetical protein F8A10_19315 [Paracoccus kondratievae]